MSPGWIALTFLLALPVAVWLLAAAASIIDVRHEPRALLRACLRLAISVVAVLMIALVTHPGVVVITGAAVITVTALHIAWFYILRKLLLGVPAYTLEPANPPLLQLEADAPSRDDRRHEDNVDDGDKEQAG